MRITQPALWAALMIFMVDVLVVLVLVGAPLQFYLESGGCFQWWLLLGVILLLLPFLCTTAIIQMLQNPYAGEHGDVYNCDALMGSTEQACFSLLRARFDEDEKRETLTRAAKDTPPQREPIRRIGIKAALKTAKTFKWANGELLSDRSSPSPEKDDDDASATAMASSASPSA